VDDVKIVVGHFTSMVVSTFAGVQAPYHNYITMYPTTVTY
jgi:hypothetical protein